MTIKYLANKGTVILLFLIVLQELLAKKLEYLSCDYKPNAKYFNNFNISIINNTICAEISTKEPILAGVKIHLDIELRLNNSKIYNSLITHDVDVCKILKSFRNSIYKKWLQSVLSHGNYDGKCPTPPGHYYVKSWQLEEDLIPSFLLSGDYRMKGRAYYGRSGSKNEEVLLNYSFLLKLT